MAQQTEFGDILAAMRDWEAYLSDWIVSMKKAKQPDPTKEQVESLREVWVEGWTWGRNSKR